MQVWSELDFHRSRRSCRFPRHVCCSVGKWHAVKRKIGRFFFCLLLVFIVLINDLGSTCMQDELWGRGREEKCESLKSGSSSALMFFFPLFPWKLCWAGTSVSVAVLIFLRLTRREATINQICFPFVCLQKSVKPLLVLKSAVTSRSFCLNIVCSVNTKIFFTVWL